MNKKLNILLFLLIAAFFFGLGRFSVKESTQKELSVENSKNSQSPVTHDYQRQQVVASNKTTVESSRPIQRKYYKKSVEDRVKDKEIQKLLQDAFDLTLPSDGTENFDEVVDLYERIFELSPDNEKGHEFYSNYLMLKQEYDSVLPLLKTCLEKFPSNSLCNHNMTNYYSYKQNDAELTKAIGSCLKILPSHVGCLFNKAHLHIRKRDFNEALTIFLKIRNGEYSSSLSFSEGSIAYGIAMSYEGLRNRDKALEFHEIACNDGNSYSCKKVSGVIPLIMN